MLTSKQHAPAQHRQVWERARLTYGVSDYALDAWVLSLRRGDERRYVLRDVAAPRQKVWRYYNALCARCSALCHRVGDARPRELHVRYLHVRPMRLLPACSRKLQNGTAGRPLDNLEPGPALGQPAQQVSTRLALHKHVQEKAGSTCTALRTLPASCSPLLAWTRGLQAPQQGPHPTRHAAQLTSCPCCDSQLPLRASCSATLLVGLCRVPAVVAACL